MAYDMETLKAKVVDFYPEIDKHGLETSLTFDKAKNAEACMEGNKCIYLGVQIAQFVKNFELEE